MSEQPPLMSPQTFGLALTAVLGFFGAIIAALLRWFGVRSSQDAPLQEALNHRVDLMMRGWETHDARSSALIIELRHEIEILEDQLGDARRDQLELTGEIANLKQAAESRLRLEESRGTSPIPEDSALRHRSDEGDGI